MHKEFFVGDLGYHPLPDVAVEHGLRDLDDIEAVAALRLGVPEKAGCIASFGWR